MCETKVFRYVEDDCDIKPGTQAYCFKFTMDELEDVRKKIILLSAQCAYQNIDSEKSREEQLKHAQWLIDNKSYTFHVCEAWQNYKDAKPYKDWPEELKNGRDLPYNNYVSQDTLWAPWTAEDLIASCGWEEDEVYWFAITKDGTYTYQLILKEGDWIAFCPRVGKMYGNQYFMNIGKDFGLPYKSGWKEETNGILSEEVL